MQIKVSKNRKGIIKRTAARTNQVEFKR